VKLGVRACSFGECEKGNAGVPVVKMIKVPIMNLHTDNRDDKVPIMGQSELTATNAPVGRSVHWMGCVFSFGAEWGS